MSRPNIAGVQQMTQMAGMARLRIISNYPFEWIAKIDPMRDTNGEVLSLLPQSRYVNEAGLTFNNYGTGPFCKFRIPSNLKFAGVYLITVNNMICYVGECDNLSRRVNNGYGNISPRNCYVRGQETNCRINALIRNASVRGEVIDLWFQPMQDYKAVEAKLRSLLKATWNKA